MKNSTKQQKDFRQKLENIRLKNLKEIKGGADIIIIDLSEG